MTTTLRAGVDAGVFTARYAAGVELLLWLGKNIPIVVDGGDAMVDVAQLRYNSGAWSGGEQRVVAVALSLIAGDPVNLSDVLGGLGGEHRRQVVAAITAAAR